MIADSLRACERSYLGYMRARYAAPSSSAPADDPVDGQLLPLPPPHPLQGSDRSGAGPVPLRLDAMRAAAVDEERALSVALPLRLTAALARHPHLLLHGSQPQLQPLLPWLAGNCARCGWGYVHLGLVAQPVPLLLRLLPDAHIAGLEERLVAHLASELERTGQPPANAAALLDVWGRQRRLLLLLDLLETADGDSPLLYRQVEWFAYRHGHRCRIVAAGPDPLPRGATLAYSFVSARLLPAISVSTSPDPVDTAPPGQQPALAGPDPDMRLAAVEAFGHAGESASNDALRQSLRDLWHEVRGAAAVALGVVGDEAVLPALAMALGDPSAAVRTAAAAAIGQIGGVFAVDLLLRGLDSYYADVRAASAQALGALQAQVAMPRLGLLLEDRAAAVRLAAAESLAAIGGVTLARLAASLTAPAAATRRLAACALGFAAPQDAWPALACALHDPALGVRTEAVCALGKLGVVEGWPALVEAAADSEPAVQIAAAEALGWAGGTPAAPEAAYALVRLLSAAEPGVRTAAIPALLRLGPAAAPALLSALAAPDPALRWLAIHILGVRGGEGVVPLLAAALADPYSAVRWRAAETLGALGQEAARPLLLAVQQDRNPLVRAAVQEALRQISSLPGGVGQTATSTRRSPLLPVYSPE